MLEQNSEALLIASFLKKFKADTSLVDIFAIVHGLSGSDDDDSTLSEIMGRFLMTAKLTHADDIVAMSSRVREQGATLVKRDEEQAESARRVSELYRRSKFEREHEGRKLRKEIQSLVDDLLNEQLTELNPRQMELAKQLETAFDLPVYRKGWFGTRIAFRSKSAVNRFMSVFKVVEDRDMEAYIVTGSATRALMQRLETQHGIQRGPRIKI